MTMPIFKLIMKWLFGLLFIGFGANHFLNTDFYVPMMPPYLPWHRELIYLSGACEIVVGGFLLVPRYSLYAAWGLIALLIAVFPANLHMALNPSLYPKFSPVGQWLRLPAQGLLIAWAYWFTGETGRRPSTNP
jgi:uncharacterized membrane protein